MSCYAEPAKTPCPPLMPDVAQACAACTSLRASMKQGLRQLFLCWVLRYYLSARLMARLLRPDQSDDCCG